jgi:integrase/recombinase XerD
MKNCDATKPTLAGLLDSFFRQNLIAQRGASPATIACYRDSLRLFVVFAARRAKVRPAELSMPDIDRDSVLAFLDYLESERGNGIRTRNCRLAGIHSFFHHVASRDPAAMSIANGVLGIKAKRTSKPMLGYLSQPDVEAILNQPNRSQPQGRRNHALLLFLARTGARVSEAIGVNVEDLTLHAPSQVLLRGKGSKQRVVPLTKDTAAVLRAHIEELGIVTRFKAPVFVNSRGQRLSRFGVLHILRKTATVAADIRPFASSLRSISPHTLRHSLAMGLLQSRVDPVIIQAWLGHASLDTTHQYMEANVEMKRRALEQCETPETVSLPYRPSDEVLAVLESL